MPTLQQLPKIELHLHLDCSLSFDFVQAFAPEVDLKSYERDFIVPPKVRDLADFLTRAEKSIALMQTREQLRASVVDLFRQLAADNIIYAEIRFAPLEHCGLGLGGKEVVEVVELALREQIAATGIEARLILCTLRQYSADQSIALARLAVSCKSEWVVGMDIAGDEGNFALDAHVEAFAYAKNAGLYLTAHAGEARGPESVWETLEKIRPHRIGHGVRAMEAPELVTHLLEQGIHCEVCPTSNVQTDIYQDINAHALDAMYRRGLNVSVNTDGRTLVNVSLTEEYRKVQAAFTWTKVDFLACNIHAIEAAFIPEQLKAQLRQRVHQAFS